MSAACTAEAVTLTELEAAEAVTAAVISSGGTHDEIQAAVRYEMALADEFVATTADAEAQLDEAAYENELCIELELGL
jgi:hypothetical protein